MEAQGIGRLAAALAKAQGSMEHAVKDKANPHLKSKYADLASVWDACRKPLADNELAVVQLVQVADENFVAVETRLLHSSGEQLSATCAVPVAQKTAQGVGSAITYARRYGLSAMVGVASDDDDGHAASMRQGPPVKPAPPVPAPSARSVTLPQGVAAVKPALATPPPEDALAAEVASLRAAIEGATGMDSLTKLTARLRALPDKERAEMRALYEVPFKRFMGQLGAK